jgi:hypothetical protein
MCEETLYMFLIIFFVFLWFVSPGVFTTHGAEGSPDDSPTLLPVPCSRVDRRGSKLRKDQRIRHGRWRPVFIPPPSLVEVHWIQCDDRCRIDRLCGHLEAGGPGLVLNSAAGWCVSEGKHVSDEFE